MSIGEFVIGLFLIGFGCYVVRKAYKDNERIKEGRNWPMMTATITHTSVKTDIPNDTAYYSPRGDLQLFGIGR